MTTNPTCDRCGAESDQNFRKHVSPETCCARLEVQNDTLRKRVEVLERVREAAISVSLGLASRNRYELDALKSALDAADKEPKP